MNMPSPCIGVCRLDGNDVCLGCFRSRDEIARWTQMTDSERFLVMAALDERKKDPGLSETSPFTNVCLG
jgi:predicted Fe-S protein YdhL (DUF1289 family)